MHSYVPPYISLPSAQLQSHGLQPDCDALVKAPVRLVQSITSPNEILNAAKTDTEQKIILPFCNYKIAFKK